jgi:O-antigen/teichoic acid export membrane protein
MEGGGPVDGQAVDRLRGNLKHLTISGGLVSATGHAVKLLLSIAYIAVMARLLTPEDFGLVAMGTAVMSVLRVFKDAGLSTATVQRSNITDAQVSNLFWANVVVGALSAMLLILVTPVVAWFYREPRVEGVTAILATTFLLSGLIVQHQALLARQMRFGVIVVIDVGSMTVAYATGIVMAVGGWGAWSLVGSMVLVEVCRVLLTWSMLSWRPRFPSRSQGTRSLLNFGANLTLGSFVYSMARGSDSLLIGRIYGSESVGIYSRASVLLMRPMEEFLVPMNTVFVPVLSRLLQQPERYRHAFLRIHEAIALASFPLTALLLPMADPLIAVVLGARWEGAVMILKGFTMVALYFPLANVSTWLFTSQGRGRDWVRATSVVSCITIGSFLAGLPFGPIGVAVSYSVSCVFVQLPFLYYWAGREGPVSTRDLWTGFLRHLPVWIVVCAGTYGAKVLFLSSSAATQLLLCVPAGILSGLIFVLAFAPSRRAVVEAVAVLRESAVLRR